MQGHKHWTERRGQRRSSATTAKATQGDLFDAIEQGDFPKWTVQVQIMPELEAEQAPPTTRSTSPRSGRTRDYPLIDVGVLELNRNPENYFAEIEQAAFCAVQHRAGHRLLARQDAAGPHLRLRRRASLSRSARNYEASAGEPPRSSRCTTITRDGPMRFDRQRPATGRLLRAELVQRPGAKTRP